VKSNAAETQEYSERSAVRVELDVEELAPSPSLVVAVEETEAAETQPSGLDQQRIDHQLREENAKELQAIEADIVKFKRMVQVNPRNSFAWDALGSLYKSAGLYKEAILAHQQAISIDSSKASYYHHLGLVYAAEGRDEDAINAFQKVIELDPDYSLAHATLGGYYRKMGLEDLAQKHIGKAMRIIYDSENEYNRACLEAICGNVDKAIELLQIALRNKQTYVDWVLRDPDLDFIRGDPRFKQLISEYTR
jgi:tetratricopeptide (TPR) repeat protein